MYAIWFAHLQAATHSYCHIDRSCLKLCGSCTCINIVCVRGEIFLSVTLEFMTDSDDVEIVVPTKSMVSVTQNTLSYFILDFSSFLKALPSSVFLFFQFVKRGFRCWVYAQIRVSAGDIHFKLYNTTSYVRWNFFLAAPLLIFSRQIS